MDIKEIFNQLLNHEELTREETKQLLVAITKGELNDAEIAASSGLHRSRSARHCSENGSAPEAIAMTAKIAAATTPARSNALRRTVAKRVWTNAILHGQTGCLAPTGDTPSPSRQHLIHKATQMRHAFLPLPCC